MFAVIKTGGKQYRVAADNVITVEKVAGEPGEIIQFGEVLMLGGESPTIGSPTVAGASVAGEVVQQGRGEKVIAFKKRRRQNSKRKRGHRQEFTMVRITEILTDGQTPNPTPPPRAKAKPKPVPEQPVSAEEGAGSDAEEKVAKPRTRAKAEPKSKSAGAKGAAKEKKK
jgi:large subunit ribosomal protein L21